LLACTDEAESEIPLPNVKKSVLEQVVKYLNYHAENPAKEIEKPLKSANMSEVVSKFDAAFVDVEQEALFELILAANYMDIKPLLDLSCAKVASLIKGSCVPRCFDIYPPSYLHTLILQARPLSKFGSYSTSSMTLPPKRKRQSGPRISGPKKANSSSVCYCEGEALRWPVGQRPAPVSNA